MGMNPDAYHGRHKKGNFFEGWYIKVSNRTAQRSLALIPGINKSRNAKHSHAFIQILDSRGPTALYTRHPQEDFSALPGRFQISVAKSSFHFGGLDLQIADQRRITGSLAFEDQRSWPAWGPFRGSMSLLNQLTFLECYSQVVVMSGICHGALRIDDEVVDFNEGSVYIEKNWGQRFPKGWIWLQASSFGNSHISVTASVARVPVVGGLINFTGFIVGVTLGDRFVGFTSYNGARLRLVRENLDPLLICERNGYKLLLRVQSKPEQFAGLLIPKGGRMVYGVQESLSAKLTLTVFHRGELLFNGSSEAAGVEYGGSWKKMTY